VQEKRFVHVCTRCKKLTFMPLAYDPESLYVSGLLGFWHTSSLCYSLHLANDLALVYRGVPFLIGTNPFKPSAFLAFETADAHFEPYFV